MTHHLISQNNIYFFILKYLNHISNKDYNLFKNFNFIAVFNSHSYIQQVFSMYQDKRQEIMASIQCLFIKQEACRCEIRDLVYMDGYSGNFSDVANRWHIFYCEKMKFGQRHIEGQTGTGNSAAPYLGAGGEILLGLIRFLM
jgi:hypothetical protein